MYLKVLTSSSTDVIMIVWNRKQPESAQLLPIMYYPWMTFDLIRDQMLCQSNENPNNYIWITEHQTLSKNKAQSGNVLVVFWAAVFFKQLFLTLFSVKTHSVERLTARFFIFAANAYLKSTGAQLDWLLIHGLLLKLRSFYHCRVFFFFCFLV